MLKIYFGLNYDGFYNNFIIWCSISFKWLGNTGLHINAFKLQMLQKEMMIGPSTMQGTDLNTWFGSWSLCPEKLCSRFHLGNAAFQTSCNKQIHSIYIQWKDPLWFRVDQDILVVDGIVFIYNFGCWCLLCLCL